MSANELIVKDNFEIFSNAEFCDVRTKIIDNTPWFVGKDVAEALGYTNTRDALTRHVDDEDKNTVVIHDGTSGNPNITVINESGVYSLTFSSKLPKAKKFKRWITSEVLPSLRKTGTYTLLNEIPLTREEMAMYWTNMMAALRDYTQVLDRRDSERDEILNKIIANQMELYKSIALTQKLYQGISVDISNIVKGLVTQLPVAEPVVVNKPVVSNKKSLVSGEKPHVSKKSWTVSATEKMHLLYDASGKNHSQISREIYGLMRQHGCRIKKANIAAISKNKKHREIFEVAMEELNKKYSAGSKSTYSTTHFSAVNKMPSEIKELIQEYAAKKNISYKLATGRIYKLIEEAGNISLDKMQREYCGRIGYSTCSKSYMIFHNNQLMDLFRKVIKEA